MTMEKSAFGRLPDGREAALYTLTNKAGGSVSISDLGGTLVSLKVPDREGKLTDVLLGYGQIQGYYPNKGYLGALIGRVGNRINRGQCQLDGRALHLNANSHGHHLHGGTEGFDRKLWSATMLPESGQLVLEYVSPDGEENYPGTLRVKVTYAFSEDNALSIHYAALCDRDTLCNLTNHAYFNLAGEGSGDVLDHEIMIAADRFTVVDQDCIPTGELRPVDGTPFDLRKPIRLGDGLAHQASDQQMTCGNGYDHNFCLNGAGLRQVASVYAPSTGIRMTVDTDQPGVQFYTGNSLQGVNVAKCGHIYGQREGLCLETQNYPDAINHPNFPSPVLRAGRRYDTTTIYRFSV